MKLKLQNYLYVVIFLFACSCKLVYTTAAKREVKREEEFSSTKNGPKLVLVHCSLRASESNKITKIGQIFDGQLNQTLTLIKSLFIMMESTDFVEILIVTNNKKYFESIMTAVKKWGNGYNELAKLSYVTLRYPPGREWMEGIYSPCSTFSIFLPDILPYDSVIYVDTDVIFLENIHQLWSEIGHFGSSALLGAAIRIFPHTDKFPAYRNSGIGTGVMVMNLTRMRMRQVTQKALSMSMPYLSEMRHGQEDMLSLYFHKFPEEFHQLSCHWSYTPQRCSHPCNSEGDLRGISILHGNFGAFMGNSEEPMFRSVYKAFANTDLSANVDLGNLLQRIKSELSQQMNQLQSPCAEYPEFQTLVLARLERQFKQQKTQLSPRKNKGLTNQCCDKLIMSKIN